MKFLGVLVALRQTFVRRCHGGLRSSRACGVLAIQNMSAGVRLGAVKLWGDNRGCPRFIGSIDFLIALPSAQDWLLFAKHLFVAAMVAWVHPGLPRIGNSAAFILSQLPAWAKKE